VTSPGESGDRSTRIAGLRRFAVGITLLNFCGYAFLGFEASLAQPLTALATAYVLEILFELVDARTKRRPNYLVGGLSNVVDFLLSAHITGLAVSMLLYPNERLWPVVFAVAVALGSKKILQIPAGSSARHFLNPSNFGITATLLLMPWVGPVIVWQFTNNVAGAGDVILPLLVLITGTLLNARFTGRLPLVAGWLGAYALEAVSRSLIAGTPIAPALLSMTGPAFVIFSLYMVTDPATTPSEPRAQVAFGVAVAAAYGLLVLAHVMNAIFYALTIVCAIRGLSLYVRAWSEQRARSRADVAAQTAGLAGQPVR
jgi:Na+-translocating ferredoxin:NAD+ oxidoreductase RnfD subunit